MSWIWNVILSFSDEEFWPDEAEEALDHCVALENVNRWLQADTARNHGPLTNLAACVTGNETGMSANVWGGGFQHFDMQEFLAVVSKQRWRDPANVQVFIQGEEDSKFTLMELRREPAEQEPQRDTTHTAPSSPDPMSPR